jgi:hypothetical protein
MSIVKLGPAGGERGEGHPGKDMAGRMVMSTEALAGLHDKKGQKWGFVGEACHFAEFSPSSVMKY